MDPLAGRVENRVQRPEVRAWLDQALATDPPPPDGQRRVVLALDTTPDGDVRLLEVGPRGERPLGELPVATPPEAVRLACRLAVKAICARRAWARQRRSQRHWVRQAQRDPLTGLPNRRSWQRRLNDLLAGPTPFCLVLLDLDGFKPFNDTRGHLAGDAALKRLAQGLKTRLRESDAPARLGGDEFAALLVGLEVQDAPAVVERLRQAAGPELTLSAGFTCWTPGVDVGLQAIYAAADSALLAAKRAGRNQARFQPLSAQASD